MARPDSSHLQSLLNPARQVLLLLPQHPAYDVVASGLALKLAFESASKSATIACPDPMTVEFNRLVGVDTVLSSVAGRNLVIAFPGQTEHVDKISYNLEKGELQLVISPKAGAPDLDHRRLRFIPGTGHADLILLIGVGQLLDLGPFYTDTKDLLSSAQVVSLTRDLPRDNYTSTQLFDPDASSLSELTAGLIDSLGLSLNADIATNLFSGLEKSTDNFRSPAVSHSTFEVAAQLMRRGAHRSQPLSGDAFPPGSIPGQAPTPPQPIPPAPVPSSAKGYGTDSAKPAADNTPPDWYEPKIYHGPVLQ